MGIMGEMIVGVAIAGFGANVDGGWVVDAKGSYEVAVLRSDDVDGMSSSNFFIGIIVLLFLQGFLLDYLGWKECLHLQ